MGYSVTRANLLTIPVYALVSVVTCGVGFYADRKGQRGLLSMYVPLSLFSFAGVSLIKIDSICLCVGRRYRK